MTFGRLESLGAKSDVDGGPARASTMSRCPPIRRARNLFGSRSSSHPQHSRTIPTSRAEIPSSGSVEWTACSHRTYALHPLPQFGQWPMMIFGSPDGILAVSQTGRSSATATTAGSAGSALLAHRLIGDGVLSDIDHGDGKHLHCPRVAGGPPRPRFAPATRSTRAVSAGCGRSTGSAARRRSARAPPVESGRRVVVQPQVHAARQRVDAPRVFDATARAGDSLAVVTGLLLLRLVGRAGRRVRRGRRDSLGRRLLAVRLLASRRSLGLPSLPLFPPDLLDVRPVGRIRLLEAGTARAAASPTPGPAAGRPPPRPAPGRPPAAPGASRLCRVHPLELRAQPVRGAHRRRAPRRSGSDQLRFRACLAGTGGRRGRRALPSGRLLANAGSRRCSRGRRPLRLGGPGRLGGRAG